MSLDLNQIFSDAASVGKAYVATNNSPSGSTPDNTVAKSASANQNYVTYGIIGGVVLVVLVLLVVAFKK